MQDSDNISNIVSKEFVILDTEFTAWKGSKERNWSLEWEEREIIQIGAIRVRFENNTYVEQDSLTAYVKPLINPTLSEYITALTGIRQDDIDRQGQSLSAALQDFKGFTHNGQLPVYSWGGDEAIIKQNCGLQNIPCDMDAYRFYDLREIFRSWDQDTAHLCSGELAAYFGQTLEGHKHNALHDVRSLLAGLKVLAGK